MPQFPLAKVPNQGYHKTKWHRGWFGATRDDGRLHAACDLIARPGTPIYAVDHGTILHVAKFYKGTDEITIKHPNFVVRYGEIARDKLPQFIKDGEKTVKPGQLIAWVGRLKMLHFEMYQGDVGGSLSQTWNKSDYRYVTPGNYQRRPDLIDPTPYLDQWKLWTNFTNWVEEKIEEIF
jgi:murein DD-endopeptidase MepM/ murein hydrolase activator NlpD